MFRWLLVLCAALLVLPAGEAFAQSKEVAEAKRAYAQKKPDKARALLAKACEKRSGEGCDLLALMQLDGEGGPQDIPAATANLVKACDMTYALSCETATQIYLGGARGKGQIPVDDKKAVSLAHFGCRWGAAGSCTDMSFFYANGRGVEKDPVKAREYAYKACSAGHATGCSNYGYFLQAGTGGPVDKAGAYLYLDKACKAGNKGGCDNIAKFFPNGAPAAGQGAGGAGQLARGLQSFNSKLYSDAYTLLRPFAEQGDAKAEYTVGWMLAYGQGTNRDYLQAARFLASAARKGDKESLAVLQKIGPNVEQAAFVHMIDTEGPDMSSLGNFGFEVAQYCTFRGPNCTLWRQRYNQAERANNQRAFAEQMARAWAPLSEPRAGFGNDPRRGGETFGACIRRQARTRGVTAGTTLLDFDCY
ncbi:MAG: tetratricopeptide repeat protein [Erythrobacter sp.]|jgi:TPR repeat protein|nr:tetratricopeptide repeat protein [Erythrobacter sp.]